MGVAWSGYCALPFDLWMPPSFFSDGVMRASLPEVEIVSPNSFCCILPKYKGMGVWSSQGNKKLFTLQDQPWLQGLHSLIEQGTEGNFSPTGREEGIAETPANDYPQHTDSPFGQGACLRSLFRHGWALLTSSRLRTVRVHFGQAEPAYKTLVICWYWFKARLTWRPSPGWWCGCLWH